MSTRKQREKRRLEKIAYMQDLHDARVQREEYARQETEIKEKLAEAEKPKTAKKGKKK